MRRHTAALEDMPEEELHELRLEAKKARYAAEFFRSLFPAKAAKRYIAGVTAIQDRLGALNDAYVSRRLMEQLHGRRASRAAARAEGLVTGWFEARIENDRKHMQGDWERYLDIPRFWKRD
jgi:CHAD domain-containing protein